MDIIYRQSQQSDLPQILNLLTKARGDTSNLDVNALWVAIDNDKVIGCVRIKDLTNECFELASLAVDKDYRNQKIGSALIQKLLVNYKKRPIYLLCFKENENFYGNNGFKLIQIDDLSKILKEEYFRVKDIFSQENKVIIGMRIN